MTDRGYGDFIEEAHAEAGRLGLAVSDIVPSWHNAYRSFFVAPDGSKEGWAESRAGDQARAAFLAWLATTRHEDGSPRLDWIEVRFGGDEIELSEITAGG